MSIARIALDVPLPTLFDYTAENVAVGQRVLVPFGRKQVVGVVMECAADSDLAAERVKPVTRVLDDAPPLPAELLAMLRFCSDYYHYPLGMTVLSALPSRLRSGRRVAFKDAAQYMLSASGRALTPDDLPKRKVVQRRIVAALQAGALNSAQLRALSPGAPAALKALRAAGWVEPGAAPVAAAACAFDNAHTLTAEQQRAVDAVAHARGYACFLLHGVTGSGKTEVYVHLMHRALQRGGQVLLLVPEINLTPQLENYFRSRFPDAMLASLHSGLNDGERAHNWLNAQSGRARIVLGTRLAVFAPLPQLALLIVDEEHDASF
ncbi:MAG: primosomal protein N' (replication factor Y) (superfamily II helicase), partial [Gallionellaceae bacterium]